MYLHSQTDRIFLLEHYNSKAKIMQFTLKHNVNLHELKHTHLG